MTTETATPTSDDVPEDGATLTRVAARLFDTPLLIHEGKLSQILRVLGPRLGFDHAGQVEPLGHRTPDAHHRVLSAAPHLQGMRWEYNREGGYYNVGPAAVVPVVGSLVQRAGGLDALSGLLSYERIERKIDAAMQDGRVEQLVLDYDTPGGEAAGAFDLADRLYERRGEKPMTAVVNEFAASAGYLLASTADEVVIPRTGMAGSIGVVTAHVDMSEALEKRGFAVTFIYAGKKKIDGNPYEPLPDRVKAEWQAEIEEMYGIFVSAVARNRSLMSEQEVRDTEAGVFMGRSATKIGLADRVNSLANEVHNSAVRRGGAFRLSQSTEEPAMTDQDREAAIAQARAEGEKQGREAAEAETQTKIDAAVAEAVTGERERIKAIVNADEAKGRMNLATHIAFETDMDAEAAQKMLGASPQEQTNGQLAAAMEQLGSPMIPTTEVGGEEQQVPRLDKKAIIDKHNENYFKSLRGE